VQVLGRCKDSFKECVQNEDYEEEGFISLSALKECFEILDLYGDDQVDDKTFDYIAVVLYQKSESIEKLKYQPLFDLMEGKLLLN